MIKYALVCEKDHSFESWFPDSESFDRLLRRGLVACPECDSSRVAKALMAPAVVGAKKAGAPAAVESQPVNVALVDERQRRLRELAKELRQEIITKTDDVGRRFPEEARAIHAGDAPARSIRGQATIEEARALIEEGVGVLPVPQIPDELN
ncbi:MAG TPA: DUF1178 family protein [Roseiarcus sp.]|nr:DUF1178 family protein [Roseiarcus sp.]